MEDINMRGSKPTVLLILDGYGLNDNPEGKCHCNGKDSSN